MLIISNPNAGDKSGPLVLNDILLLLKRHRPSLVIDIKETNGPGDAGHIAVNYLRGLSSISNSDDATILISGGDTTVHEVVNQLTKDAIKQPARVILIPSGTANALYHSLFPPKDCETFLRGLPPALQEEVKSLDKNTVSRLYSVLFFLSDGSPWPLQSTRTSILNEQDEVIEQVVSCVVVSSSLHASILDIAESLRSEHPGIERFKIAAGQSITQWSQARLIVNHPHEIYDPVTTSFKQGIVTGDSEGIAGPFAYFLTTTNVDRLEQEFRITPLATSIPVTSEDGWMDVVIIRPSRDPSIGKDGLQSQDEAIRQKFAATTMQVLWSAYKDGSHVSLGYDASGKVIDTAESGEKSVVEYLRVKKWEWIPEVGSATAHLICVDGEILKIPPRGRAKCSLLYGIDRVELEVYGGI